MISPGYRRMVLAIFLACLVHPADLSAAEPRVGVATVDITPPLGVPLAGYYHERGADGVLDPLYCKAMILESGEVRMAFVVLDLIGVTRSITDLARTEIEKTTGVPSGHIMVSATHAHTGPILARRGQRDSDMGGQNQIAVDFTEALPAKIAACVRAACEHMQPAQFRVAKSRCENLAFNRRYFMRDGTVGWNPGKMNPDIMMPAGPVDPEVNLLYVEKPGATGPGQSIASYIRFAMHPDTTGGSKISADWPGALGRVLAGYHGSNHITLVANGTCGNVNHLDFSWPWPQGTGIEQHRIATILGSTVFQAYKDLQPIHAGALRAKSVITELALPEVTPAQIEEASQVVAVTKNDQGGNFMKLVRAYRVLDIAGRKGKPHRVEVQVISWGPDVAWVGLPGEVFAELGLAIKKRSPFPHTFVVELANENVGYIPDRRSFAEGNYEPESARCAAGSGELLAETAAGLLAELHQ
jgi:neutral ceramidase